MNSKKSNLYHLLSALLFGGVSVLVSCDNEKDVYNPNHMQEEAKKAFPVKDIDPNQTWEMSAICHASVSVNEKTGGAYTIKVYTANPYNTDGNAFLLAKTSITDGQTVNFKFDIPAALQYVYVMRMNEKGYSSAIPIAIENGKIKATFGQEFPTSRAASNSREMTNKAQGWQTDIPQKNDLQIFPAEAPAGSLKLNKDQWEVQQGANYIVEPGAGSISTNTSANFYISGDVSLSNIYIGQAKNARIFILPGSTLRMNSLAIAFNASLSIGNGAKLICKNDFNLSSQAGTVYNAGTIEIDGNYEDSRGQNLEFYNLGSFKFAAADLKDTHFYNGGILIGAGMNHIGTTINLSNSASFINAANSKVTAAGPLICSNNATVVNTGELAVASFKMSNKASFYNESVGKVVISGESNVSDNSTVWNNEGYFQAEKMTIAHTSGQWINKCQLYIDGTMDISNGNLIMDAGSYVQCLNMCMNMSRIEMGNYAFFNVLNDAILQENVNKNGFYATGNQYALFKAKSVSAFKDPYHNQVNANNKYSGKLYIASDKHYNIFNSQGNPAKYTLENGAQLTSYAGTEFTVQPSSCSPGYNPVPDEENDDKVQNYAYAFEDMTTVAGDYDFNDVVLYVTSPIDGKITVTLKAAGATKQLAVRFKNKKTGEDTMVYEDIHAALGVDAGTITNTGITTGKRAETKTFDVGNDFSITEHSDFYIVDAKDKIGIHITEFTTFTTTPPIPYAIRIACANWKWPKERTDITKAYTKFADWAKEMTSNLDWYNNPESIVNENVIGIE